MIIEGLLFYFLNFKSIAFNFLSHAETHINNEYTTVGQGAIIIKMGGVGCPHFHGKLVSDVPIGSGVTPTTFQTLLRPLYRQVWSGKENNIILCSNFGS